jgi:hypothetical protein
VALPQDEGQPSIASTLGKWYARYGTEEIYLAKHQRNAIYHALFGSCQNGSEEQGDFPRLRNELIYACAAFSERVFNTGEEMLRERVRTTHRPFKEYLTGLLGDSVRWSRNEALGPLTEQTCYAILRNRGVAGVFGIAAVPKADWPYVEDSNADKLISEISKQLVVEGKVDESVTKEGYPGQVVTREQISNLQRAALRGAEALVTIIDYVEAAGEEDLKNLNNLITACYTWGSALKALEAPVSAAEPGLMEDEAFAIALSKLGKRIGKPITLR